MYHSTVRIVASVWCIIALASLVSAFGSLNEPLCAPIGQIDGPGTTSGLDVIYKGICYQTTHSAQCDASWLQFQQIVLSKDPAGFNWRDFDSLFSVLSTRTEPGKATFWAGDGILVHELSHMNSAFQTLENTFPASSLNGLSFCPTTSTTSGTANDHSLNLEAERHVIDTVSEANVRESSFSTRSAAARSFNMQQCVQYITPGEPLVPASDPFYRPHYEFGDAFGAFWQAASIRFAQLATGKIHIVFEVPESGNTFCSTDFFGSIELPSLNRSQVSGIDVMIATNSRNTEERCNSGSFVNLRTLVATLLGPDFEYTCRDDPYELEMVRCSTQSENNAECQKWLVSRFGNEEPAANQAICKGPCGYKRTFTFLAVGIGIGSFIIGFLLAAWIPMLNPFLRSINRRIAPTESTSSAMSHPPINEEGRALLDPESPDS